MLPGNSSSSFTGKASQNPVERIGRLRGMGKHGPCRHCGVTTTPLWRNGPPDKPVLCNACGSRWRTKGSLANYTPLHARELIDSEEIKVPKVKSLSFKPKEKKLLKIKQASVVVKNECEMPYSDQNFRKILEGDTSNRSSSGSATSYTESCAHFGTTEASDLTGSAQSNIWESQVPSKRRTCVIRTKSSPVEKLTKDLYTILQEQQSSYFSSTEEDLLYESETPLGSFEIGNGSVLLRYPKVIEEESEASSLPIDNKSYVINEAYSGSVSFVNSENKGLKKSTEQAAQHVKREKSSSDKFHILRDRDSPLGFTDLKDVVNFEVFMRHMTNEEQQQLMKYLPSIDKAKYPESLRTMFTCPQFVDTLSYFQQLLREGIFEPSMSGVNYEKHTTLKRLLLQNSTRSTWVEYYKKLKDVKNKQSTGVKEVAIEPKFHGHSNLSFLKRCRDVQNLHAPDLRGTMRSPKRVAKSGGTCTNPSSTILLHPNSAITGSKLMYDNDEYLDNDGSCFSPRTIFATPPDRSSMLCSLQFTDSSDQDLLLDLPCNTLSFPEAELLYHPWSQKKPVVANNFSAESGIIADGEVSLSNFPASTSFRTQKPRR